MTGRGGRKSKERRELIALQKPSPRVHPVGVFLVSEYKILWANKRVAEMIGLPVDSLLANVYTLFWRIREWCGWNHAGRVAVAG